jgi:cytochrome c-type biogenesis protein CcmH/NrfF
MVSFAFNLIFKTPLGLVLLAFVFYRFYIRKKSVEVDDAYETFENENNEEVIDVDYEEFE